MNNLFNHSFNILGVNLDNRTAIDQYDGVTRPIDLSVYTDVCQYCHAGPRFIYPDFDSMCAECILNVAGRPRPPDNGLPRLLPRESDNDWNQRRQEWINRARLAAPVPPVPPVPPASQVPNIYDNEFMLYQAMEDMDIDDVDEFLAIQEIMNEQQIAHHTEAHHNHTDVNHTQQEPQPQSEDIIQGTDITYGRLIYCLQKNPNYRQHEQGGAWQVHEKFNELRDADLAMTVITQFSDAQGSFTLDFFIYTMTNLLTRALQNNQDDQEMNSLFGNWNQENMRYFFTIIYNHVHEQNFVALNSSLNFVLTVMTPLMQELWILLYTKDVYTSYGITDLDRWQPPCSDGTAQMAVIHIGSSISAITGIVPRGPAEIPPDDLEQEQEEERKGRLLKTWTQTLFSEKGDEPINDEELQNYIMRKCDEDTTFGNLEQWGDAIQRFKETEYGKYVFGTGDYLGGYKKKSRKLNVKRNSKKNVNVKRNISIKLKKSKSKSKNKKKKTNKKIKKNKYLSFIKNI